MKIKIYKKNIIIYISKTDVVLNDISDYDIYIRKLILKIKNKYKSIFGLYKVDIYKNDRIGLIIDIKKEKEFDFFKDFIELKINLVNNGEIFLKFKDFEIIKDFSEKYYYNNDYYIDVNYFSKEEIFKLCEFFKVIYGKKINKKNWIKLI